MKKRKPRSGSSTRPLVHSSTRPLSPELPLLHSSTLPSGAFGSALEQVAHFAGVMLGVDEDVLQHPPCDRIVVADLADEAGVGLDLTALQLQVLHHHFFEGDAVARAAE